MIFPLLAHMFLLLTVHAVWRWLSCLSTVFCPWTNNHFRVRYSSCNEANLFKIVFLSLSSVSCSRKALLIRLLQTHSGFVHNDDSDGDKSRRTEKNGSEYVLDRETDDDLCWLQMQYLSLEEICQTRNCWKNCNTWIDWIIAVTHEGWVWWIRVSSWKEDWRTVHQRFR